MINAQRVIHMARMEMFEQKEGQYADAVEGMREEDYLSFHLLIDFVAAAVLYWGLYLALVATLFAFFIKRLNSILAISLILAGSIGYIIFEYLYLQRSARLLHKRYAVCKEVERKRIRNWEVLKEMYEQEEKGRTPKEEEIFGTGEA